jgi:NAD(P)-dependent dehydrogenase (short-subunit alcohol dehydrogenase family)
VDHHRGVIGLKLTGKVALVFGGASGLGRASAEACAEEGAKVMIADIDDEAGERVVSVIAERQGTAAFVRSNIIDEDAVRRAIRETVARFGKLDILVTSAGSESPDRATKWNFALDLFLRGPFYACKYAVEEMERNGGGSIVNIASVAGVTGSLGSSVDDSGYASAKHGVVGLTRTIALTYAKKNIRANALCPGCIRTPLTRSLHDTADGGQAFISERMRVPLDRWGEPHEIGRVAAFLASDDASYITGQPIIVDGGFMAR